VIRIRYRSANELSPGLHAAAERRGRSTTVYLLAGLSPAERRAALRRLRISARMGRDPRLPAAQLGIALLADRIRTSLGQAGAIVRSHPAGSTVPVMVISAGAIAFLALSAVSIRVIHTPRASGQPLAAGLPATSAGAIPITGGSAGRLGGVIPGGAGAASQLVTPGHTGSGPAGPGATGAAGATGGSGSNGGSGVGTILTGNAGPTPSPPAADGGGTAPAAPASAAAPATSAPAAQPSPAASAGSGGACLHLGPLGVCL
jgi:hypothetical protein